MYSGHATGAAERSTVSSPFGGHTPLTHAQRRAGKEWMSRHLYARWSDGMAQVSLRTQTSALRFSTIGTAKYLAGALPFWQSHWHG
jgi:hypothetical protein